MREELPFPDKVLQTLHNLCATAADLAGAGVAAAAAAVGGGVDVVATVAFGRVA